MRRRSNTQGIRRSGCTACKIRHKKCDEGKPRCRNCIRRKLACDQPDVFRTAMLTVTKSSRTKTTTYVASEERPVLDADDGPNVLGGTAIATDPVSSPATPGSASSESSIDGTSSPCTTLSIQPDASVMEQYLLYHYTFRMSSLLINVDSPSNPLRSVLLPRAVVSPVLNDALYAVAALHVSVGKDNPKFRTASLAYYDKTLSAFYSRIMTLPECPNRSDLEVLLLTAVFLCKYEIISGGVSNWRSHLQGVKEMLEAFQSHYLLSASETTSYVQSFIQYHSSVATITQSDAYASPQTSDPCSVDEFELELTAPVDPYMGVSARYISMLRTAAEAIMLDPDLPSNVSTMMSNAVNIFQALPSRTPYPATLDPNYDLDQMTMTYVHHIAEAYRNALIAYLHTILDRMDGYETSLEVKLQAVGMRTLLGITKDDALSACVSEMQCVPDDQSCSVGLVPLLFIVASETRNLEEYHIGTTRLGKVFQKACLGNIVPALELLHKMKQTQAGDWRELLRSYRWDLIVV